MEFQSKENKSPSLSGIELVSNHTVDVWSNETEAQSPVTYEDSPPKFPPRKLSNIRSISSASSGSSRGSITDTGATRTKTPKSQTSEKLEITSTRPFSTSTYSKPKTPIPPARTSISSERTKTSEIKKNAKTNDNVKQEFELVKQKQSERTAYTVRFHI